MASKDKPGKKPAAQITTRDFEQEYLYSKLKLNQRALKSNYLLKKSELDVATRKNSEEN